MPSTTSGSNLELIPPRIWAMELNGTHIKKSHQLFELTGQQEFNSNTDVDKDPSDVKYAYKKINRIGPLKYRVM